MQDTQLATDIVSAFSVSTTTNPRRKVSGIDIDTDRSVARRICGTPSDATKHSGKGPSRGDPGAHSVTPEELKLCDALIIPGGGLSGLSLTTHVTVQF
jgi:hypothetical protein